MYNEIKCVFRIEAKRQADLVVAADAMSDSGRAEPLQQKKQPYKGTSKWSRLLKISTLQRSIQIWSFAFIFAVKYLLLSKKFTYGKKVGRTPTHAKLAVKHVPGLSSGLHAE